MTITASPDPTSITLVFSYQIARILKNDLNSAKVIDLNPEQFKLKSFVANQDPASKDLLVIIGFTEGSSNLQRHFLSEGGELVTDPQVIELGHGFLIRKLACSAPDCSLAIVTCLVDTESPYFLEVTVSLLVDQPEGDIVQSLAYLKPSGFYLENFAIEEYFLVGLLRPLDPSSSFTRLGAWKRSTAEEPESKLFGWSEAVIDDNSVKDLTGYQQPIALAPRAASEVPGVTAYFSQRGHPLRVYSYGVANLTLQGAHHISDLGGAHLVFAGESTEDIHTVNLTEIIKIKDDDDEDDKAKEWGLGWEIFLAGGLVSLAAIGVVLWCVCSRRNSPQHSENHEESDYFGTSQQEKGLHKKDKDYANLDTPFAKDEQ